MISQTSRETTAQCLLTFHITARACAGAFSILPCKRDGADLFTTDDRLKVLTFTGSPAVRAQARP